MEKSKVRWQLTEGYRPDISFLQYCFNYLAASFHVVLRWFSSSKAAPNTIFVGNWTNQKRVRSLGDRRQHLPLPGQLYTSHAVYRICIIRLTMAPQANAALKMAVLHLRKSGITAKSVCQQTGVCERTQRSWIAAARKAGTWEELVSPAPRKRRSARGHWRKVTGVMVCAIKRRLSYNPRLSTRPKVAPPSTKY